MQLEEAATASGIEDLQRRCEVAEDRVEHLEELNANLRAEVEQLKESSESTQDQIVALERGRREDARLREDANDTIMKQKQTIDRLNDELQRCVFVCAVEAVAPWRWRASVPHVTGLQRTSQSIRSGCRGRTRSQRSSFPQHRA